MSIRAVTELAAERDDATPADSTAQFSDVLTKTIPTESLAAYTAFVAVVTTQATEEDALLAWRWGAFAGFFVLTLVAVIVSYYYKAKTTGRKVPYELVPVLLATIAWGLALPGGPLSIQLDGVQGALTITAIVIGGGAIVSVAGLPLRKGTSTTPPPPPPAGAAGGTGPNDPPPSGDGPEVDVVPQAAARPS